MHKIILLIILLFTFYTVFAQKVNPNYDAELATKVGADDYGMKQYVLMILKTATNTESNKAYNYSCFTGHMSNLDTMVKSNKLVLAGPIAKNDKAYRGIFYTEP